MRKIVGYGDRCKKNCRLGETIEVPCLSGSRNQQLELHSFADASERAYGAIVYPQAEEEGGKLSLAAKTKVAPVKQVSQPRLELCAALVRLVAYLREALKLLSPHLTGLNSDFELDTRPFYKKSRELEAHTLWWQDPWWSAENHDSWLTLLATPMPNEELPER